jgi:hypothetical protein
LIFFRRQWTVNNGLSVLIKLTFFLGDLSHLKVKLAESYDAYEIYFLVEFYDGEGYLWAVSMIQVFEPPSSVLVVLLRAVSPV